MERPAEDTLAGWAAAELPAVDRRASAGAVLRHSLASSLQRLAVNDALVRAGGDQQGVHQARVACRHLRSDLRTFALLLEPTWAGPLRDELGWLARELAAVRDLDVLGARLERQVADLPGVDADAAAGVLAVRARQRQEALEEALAALGSRRYADLVERLADAAVAPPLTPLAEEPAAEVLPPVVSRAHRKLRRQVKRLPPHPTDDQLHRLRIMVKRARYAAHATVPVVGQPAERYVGVAGRLQEVLGDLHDCAVAEDWLRGAVAGADPTTGFVLGELVARQREEAAERRRAWRRRWRQLDRRKRTAWLR